ncbi:cytoplasmic protein [Bacillus sp. MUM 116]|uniref:YdcF family protein n=1 Tax=Bacillus sp. MUM 116 TaxID=1678002 RepID=UPI0008F5AA27|nr:YdcF family protein [Bacillus sp. MUM 116]OIK15603.1 cytoplasmic protein [Bacillus sp. MUM 116]
MKKKFFIFFSIFFIAFVIYVGILHIKIVKSSNSQVPRNADYVLILGARVKGTVPSLALKCRIQTAAAYLLKNKNTVAIASGGIGSGEKISEAEAIKRGLIARGIEESRIILENQSTTTQENIQFSKKRIPKGAKTGILVTNNFHVYRALGMAHDQKLNVYGLPAKTPAKAILKSYTREYLAITKYYLEKYVF